MQIPLHANWRRFPDAGRSLWCREDARKMPEGQNLCSRDIITTAPDDMPGSW